MKKPGLDLMIAVGGPKPPKPPAGIDGPKPPMDEMEMESPDEQGKEDSRMSAIESKLDRIIDALGLNESEDPEIADAGSVESGTEPE